jgi:hypothetical protein
MVAKCQRFGCTLPIEVGKIMRAYEQRHSINNRSEWFMRLIVRDIVENDAELAGLLNELSKGEVKQ